MRKFLWVLIPTIGITLTACVTIPNSGVYENPVLRNHREQYLAQNPSLPPDIRQAIVSQQVVAGMSRTDVMAAWGPPKSCSSNFSVSPSQTVCVYTDTVRSSVLGRSYKDIYYKSVAFAAGHVVDWQLH
jgi:hypothetical protein